MPSTSRAPEVQPLSDDYDSADDPDFALPARRPKRASRSRTTRRPSGSGSAGSSSSSSAGSSSDENGADVGGHSRKRARRSALETRSGHVYCEAGPSAQAPLSTKTVGEADRLPITLAQLQALDRERTRLMLAGGPSSIEQGKRRDEGAEGMVTVRVKHRFAGEDVWVEKSVPVLSKEARVWREVDAAETPVEAGHEDNGESLLRSVRHMHNSDPGSASQQSPSSVSEGTSQGGDKVLRPLSPPRQEARATSSLPASAVESASAAAAALDQPSPLSLLPSPPSRPAALRSPPKKRKGGGLAAASLAARNKGKKMSTLEKSAQDWKRVRDEELTEVERDQLARNRQAGGGGFLEKQEFLDRVQKRRSGC